MGYYIRVLGTQADPIPLITLQRAAVPALVEAHLVDGDPWESVVLKHEDGTEIALIEKNLVLPGTLGAEEIEEFIEEVGHFDPKSAALWLQRFLPGVRVVYAFQLLFGTDRDNGFDCLHAVYSAIWKVAGGILQADGEGFSNQDGSTILWQFADHVKGSWQVGVLSEGGNWANFRMDLGNPDQRAAFRRGEIPDGIELIQQIADPPLREG